MVRLDVTALYTEINRLESLVSEQAREIARLREALADYSLHRLALITSETANQMRFTVSLDEMNRSEAVEALECMRGYVARTVPPMLEALRKARAARGGKVAG